MGLSFSRVSPLVVSSELDMDPWAAVAQTPMATPEESLIATARRVRLRALDMYKRANAGHIGSSLSCIEILVACHFDLMAEGDHFVLSKGHAAAGLYATLCEKGSVSERDLSTFYQDGTRFPAHTPPGKIEHIRFGTGSLGHGLSLAAGIALGARMRGSNQNVFCVLSDGELNEGSTWEAALFASHHRLANVRVFVDANGLQGFGKTADVMNMEPLAEKWASFGFNVATCEGHHFSELTSCMRAVSADQTKPSVVIARTVKGKGVSYMENQLAWHYLPMSDEQFAQAKREVEAP